MEGLQALEDSGSNTQPTSVITELNSIVEYELIQLYNKS